MKAGRRIKTGLGALKTNCKFQEMIWSCICWNGVGTLTKVTGSINSEKYKVILEEIIWPVIVRHFPDNQYFFQDDNAPVHRSRVLQKYRATNTVKSISWPGALPNYLISI